MNLVALDTLFLFLATTSAGGDGATKDFWPPPTGDGALRVMETKDGIRIS